MASIPHERDSWKNNMLIKPLRSTLILFAITLNAFAAPIENPCKGVSLLSLTQRGDVTNSPCVLPPKAFMLQTGYQQYRQAVSMQVYPQTALLMGLPANSELMILLPTFNQQSIGPVSGFSATTAGVNHLVNYGQKFVTGVEILITPPGGSDAFGNQGLDVLVNGIVSYLVDSKTILTLMVGGNTATEARFAGGRRFNSVNPSLSLSYAPEEKLNTFIEVFVQTKTTPDSGANYNVDTGILYLLTPNVVLDVEVAQQLGHENSSFNQYVGGGVTLLF